MKMICAIIRPHQLEGVKKTLADVGVAGLTVTNVHGSGRQKGQVERYRGSEYSIDLIAKIKIEVGVSDELCADAVNAIKQSAHTGEIGDGKIFREFRVLNGCNPGGQPPVPRDLSLWYQS